jgi:N-methylhydantoinase B
MLREPERVLHDVREGIVSRARARETYGVVIDEGGSPDMDATLKTRRGDGQRNTPEASP